MQRGDNKSSSRAKDGPLFDIIGSFVQGGQAFEYWLQYFCGCFQVDSKKGEDFSDIFVAKIMKKLQ